MIKILIAFETFHWICFFFQFPTCFTPKPLIQSLIFSHQRRLHRRLLSHKARLRSRRGSEQWQYFRNCWRGRPSPPLRLASFQRWTDCRGQVPRTLSFRHVPSHRWPFHDHSECEGRSSAMGQPSSKDACDPLRRRRCCTKLHERSLQLDGNASARSETTITSDLVLNASSRAHLPILQPRLLQLVHDEELHVCGSFRRVRAVGLWRLQLVCLESVGCWLWVVRSSR